MSRHQRGGRWPGGRRLVAGLLGVGLILAGIVLVVGWALRPGFTPAATPSTRIATGSGALVDASFRPGRLVLPALGVDAAVVPVGVESGGALTIPDNARVIGWWSGGAAPGSPVGTVLMVGHVDSAPTGPGALARLSQAPVGARLTVSGPGSEMTYVVSARRRYLKQDLPWRSLFAQGELPRLVLVTCGGDFDSRTRHYTDNVVVIATPVRQPVPDSAQTRPARVASTDVTEEQPFEVVQRFDQFELRRYPSHVVAEVTSRLPFDQAGNAAFRALFGYITGQNRTRTSVAMTAPVVQSSGTAEKVPMTAPVTQHGTDEGGYTVAFVLPASMTEQTAPEPTNPDVVIRTVPPTLSAATTYSGRSSRDSYERHLASLLEAIRAEGLEPAGAPRLARFDPPFKPWFLRHNEVVIDVVDNR